MSPKYVTPKQIATRMQVHLATVHRWIATGKLKAFKRNGSRYLILESDVEQMLNPVQPIEIELCSTLASEHAAAMRKLGVRE